MAFGVAGKAMVMINLCLYLVGAMLAGWALNRRLFEVGTLRGLCRSCPCNEGPGKSIVHFKLLEALGRYEQGSLCGCI